MLSLAAEFKQVLARRIQNASHAEVMAVAGALCADNAAPPLVVTLDVSKPERFVLESDETVLDTQTNLIWSRGNVGSGRMNWKAAKEAAEACALDGSGWRLPTIQELLSLVDYSRTEPAIDPLFRCESAYYWSATPYAGSPAGYAWYVYFLNGNAYCLVQDNDYFVRAVRPRQ